eukprot:CAMPEP_0183291206 /NCGR_PEP_ID=MMETSP0160_2-20130417/700_1 /TAXON_ID=2839 ORGANISM="Odontella Sinensis, Strain Grunow 1884" /NCGR_SAMPLE_ID=MMETSP0160_2 /ASSEMBLY_ACC=CAM_ASM_000250 /LENGTH=255 /DNA_ID=CAMNT_0025451977 /DNA_START=68 /DNA_END=835 /DNA_ORIENTATION=-
MGILQSSLVPADTPYVVVEPMTYCPRGGVGIDTSKPQGLSLDDALWSDFAQKIDPLARTLNRGFLVATIVDVVTVVAVFAIFYLGYFDQITLVIPVMVIVYLFSLGFILDVHNSKVDRQIEGIINEFRPRFDTKGHDIQYHTQYTGLCRPKSTRSERVIVFPATQETEIEAGNAANATAGDSTLSAQVQHVASSATGKGVQQSHETTSTGWSGQQKEEKDTAGASLFDSLNQDLPAKGQNKASPSIFDQLQQEQR